MIYDKHLWSADPIITNIELKIGFAEQFLLDCCHVCEEYQKDQHRNKVHAKIYNPPTQV